MTERKRWHVGDRVTYLDADVVYDAIWPDRHYADAGLGVALGQGEGEYACEHGLVVLDFVRDLAGRLPDDEVWAVWRDEARSAAFLEAGLDWVCHGLTVTPVVSRDPSATLAVLEEWVESLEGEVCAEPHEGPVDRRAEPLAFAAGREALLVHTLDLETCTYAPPPYVYPFPGIDLDPAEAPPTLRELRVHPRYLLREDVVRSRWDGEVFHAMHGALAERVELPFTALDLKDIDGPWHLLESLLARVDRRWKPRGTNMVFGEATATPTRTYDVLVTGPDRRDIADALVAEWPDAAVRWRMRRGVAWTTTASGPPIAVLTAEGIWRGLGRLPSDRDAELMVMGPLLADGELQHRNVVPADLLTPPFPHALVQQTFTMPALALSFEPELWALQRYPVLVEPPRPSAPIGTDDPGLAVARAMQALFRDGRLDEANLEAALLGPPPRHFHMAFDQHVAAMPFRTLRATDRGEGAVWLVA